MLLLLCHPASDAGGLTLWLAAVLLRCTPTLLISCRPRTPHAMAVPQHPCSHFPEDWTPDCSSPQPTCTVPLMPHGHQARHIQPSSSASVETNHPHQHGQCEATCPSFAPQPFQKGNFCKPNSDLTSLSLASQSSSVILGHCHLFGEASTDRIPALHPLFPSLVSFRALSFTLSAQGTSGLGTQWVL